MRYNCFFYLISIVLVVLTACKSKDALNKGEEAPSPASWQIKSPDENLQVILSHNATDGKLQYEVQRMSGAEVLQVLEPSPLGIVREDQQFDEGLKFVSSSDLHMVDEEYTLTSGKQLKNRNYANELVVTFANKNDAVVELTFRAYNDGVAFRYGFPNSADTLLTVTKELTGFKVPASGQSWIQPYDTVSQWTPAYEKYYLESRAGTPSPNPGGWSFPALYKANNTWLLLTESNVGQNYFGAHLKNGGQEGLYLIARPEANEVFGQGTVNARSATSRTMPWRLIIVGADLATLVESNLVTHVADPQMEGDFSWVKPGKSSWSWWSDPDSPRDFTKLKNFVDLSADMRWEYSLVDANWNEMKGGSLEQLSKYAQQKGVGLLVWYNSGGAHNTVTEQPRDIMSDPVRRKEEMKKLQAMGVKGIKVDFFQSDKQFIVQQYLDILKDAAAHKIVVNFHGCTIPRGWSRTWPNLLSMESARGAETYIFSGEFPAKAPLHNVHLVFTRNIIGPMDYTPVTFSDNRHKRLTTNAHELALGVAFESGILHLADAVESYKNIPEAPKRFLKTLPVTWDETKLLAGSPTEDVLLARRKGATWYIGYLNGTDKQKEVAVDFSFLEGGSYTASVIKDGSNSRSFAHEEFKVDNNSTKSVATLPNGGFVMVLEKP